MTAWAEENANLRSNPNFRLYYGARIISQLGDQLSVFAICWYVLDLTRSSFHMAALLALSSLSVMAVAPFGGLIADRTSRKKVMVGSDLIQGVALLAMIAALHGQMVSVGLVYFVTVLLGLCSAVFTPAANAILPGIVGGKRLGEAVAASQAATNFCTIAGMVLGGALYKLIGIAGILSLNAASFLAAAGMEERLRVAPAAAVGRGGGAPASAELRRFASDLTDGFRTVRADTVVFSLLLVNTVFTLAVVPVAMVYMPYLFNVILRSTPLQAAIPQAATWAGIIAGSAVVSRMMRRRPPERLIAGGLLVLAVHTLTVIALLKARGLMGAAWMSGACTAANAVAGAAGAFFIVPLYSLFHARSIDEFRGRFWGLENGLRTAALCAGYLTAGTLAQRMDLVWIFAGTGAVMLLLFAWVGRLPGAAGAPALRR